MNTNLRKKAKNDFGKDFFKLMNNVVFGKTIENVRKHRDIKLVDNVVFGKTMEHVRKHRHIKLVTTDKRRNQLSSEPNYHTVKYFSENVVAIEMKKRKTQK